MSQCGQSWRWQYTIQVQVTDNGGLTAVDQATVDMLNVAPTATFISTPGTLLVGQPATWAFSNPFDPGAAAVAAGFLYFYDCTNDGTFEIVESSAASHTCAYPTVGTFTARGRITEKTAASTTTRFRSQYSRRKRGAPVSSSKCRRR